MVTYQSVDVRDAVKRAARNLAGKAMEYGIRLEIPNPMKSDMAALQSISYEIRQKFKDSRRNVLFNDETMELVLDFSVAEGRPWRCMTAAQAKERKKKNKRGPPMEGWTRVPRRLMLSWMDRSAAARKATTRLHRTGWTGWPLAMRTIFTLTKEIQSAS